MTHQLRIARPVSDLERSVDMYCRGLGYRVLGSFDDHAGFDGVMIGAPGCSFHFEFTRCCEHPLVPTPTPEDLTVFYVPEVDEWRAACECMTAAGFKSIASFNPYWDVRGRTFVDPDGYRIVLQCAGWSNDPAAIP